MAQQTAVMQIAKSFRDWQREWDSFDKDGLNKPPSFDEFVEPFLAIEKEQMHKCASFWRGKENEIEKPMFDLYYNIYSR